MLEDAMILYLNTAKTLEAWSSNPKKFIFDFPASLLPLDKGSLTSWNLDLIIEAGKNKKNMKHKHLSLETSFILEIAKKLLQLLKNNDPLKKKVMLKKFDYIYCFAKGLYL